jgi:hypothetical protein
VGEFYKNMTTRGHEEISGPSSQKIRYKVRISNDERKLMVPMDITASVADLRKEIERRAKAGTVDVVMQDDYVLDDSDTCIDAIEKTTEVVVSLAANGTPEKAPSNMKVDDLRKELKLRGIEDKGVKAVLVKRLEECIAQFTPVQPPRDPVAPPAQTPLGATHSIEGLNLSYRLQSIFASAKPLTFTTKNSLKDVRAAILVAAGGVDGASDVALFSSDGVEITGDAVGPPPPGRC